MRDEQRDDRVPAEVTAGVRETVRSRNDPGASASGRIEEPAEGVLTLVCFKCGTEYYFADEQPPAKMICEKCRNGVFREFFSTQSADEAGEDFVDSTARDLDPDDAEGDTLPGDVLDLNRD